MTKFGAGALICAISLLTIAPAMADPVDKNPDANGNGWGPGGKKPSVGAPGPIAGAGIVFLAAGGGYLVARSRKRKADRPSE